MEDLVYPLHILSKAIHFKNLSGASQHVGLSQPQLSRLVSKLENELDLKLLDRTVRRKSSWTPEAIELVHSYDTHINNLSLSIKTIQGQAIPTEVRIASLEGLNSIALKFANALLNHLNIEKVFLDIMDQTHIEKKFINGEVDFILSFQAPGKQKNSFEFQLGYQDLILENETGETEVYSTFEYGEKAAKLKKKKNVLISNSLLVRRKWLETYGGKGLLPSSIKTKAHKNSVPVTLFAKETTAPEFWKQITQLKLSDY